jgi:hypothetical protein
MQPYFYAADISASWQQQPSADRLTHFLRQPADSLAGVNGTRRHLAFHATAQSTKKIFCSKFTNIGGFSSKFHFDVKMLKYLLDTPKPPPLCKFSVPTYYGDISFFDAHLLGEEKNEFAVR